LPLRVLFFSAIFAVQARFSGYKPTFFT